MKFFAVSSDIDVFFIIAPAFEIVAVVVVGCCYCRILKMNMQLV